MKSSSFRGFAPIVHEHDRLVRYQPQLADHRAGLAREVDHPRRGRAGGSVEPPPVTKRKLMSLVTCSGRTTVSQCFHSGCSPLPSPSATSATSSRAASPSRPPPAARAGPSTRSGDRAPRRIGRARSPARVGRALCRCGGAARRAAVRVMANAVRPEASWCAFRWNPETWRQGYPIDRRRPLPHAAGVAEGDVTGLAATSALLSSRSCSVCKRPSDGMRPTSAPCA